MNPSVGRAFAAGLISIALAGLVRSDEKESAKDASAAELSADEKAVVDLVNAERKKKDLTPLKANSILLKIARAHSQTMVKTGEFSHVIKGKGPADRARKAGYRYSQIGENIAYGTSLSPRGAMKMWMKSDGHRANILKKGYREIGVGIAEKEGGEKYFTQVFGTSFSPN